MENNQPGTELQSPSISKEHHIPAIIIILLLLFFWPLGVIFIFKDKKYHSWLPAMLWIFGGSEIFPVAIIMFFVAPQLSQTYSELHIANSTNVIYIFSTLAIICSVVQIVYGFVLRKKIKSSEFHVLSQKDLLITLILLIILPIVFIGLTMWNATVPIYQFINETGTKTQTISISPVPSGINTNWKTYVNTTDGYSVQYLSTWQVIETEPGNVNFYPPNFNTKQNTPGGPVLGVQIDDNTIPTGNSSSPQGIPFITDWKVVQVNDMTGYYYKTHQCAPECQTIVAFKGRGNNHNFTVFMTTSAEANGYTSIFNKMYSTFKFAQQ